MLYQRILITSSFIVTIAISNIIITNAEENNTYKTEGVEFTVGKHNPEERVNPKINKISIIKETIIINKNAEQLPGEEMVGKEEFIKESDENNMEGELVSIDDVETIKKENKENKENNKSILEMIKEILLSVKEIWEKITSLEKETNSRLNSIEKQLQDRNNKQEEVIGILEDDISNSENNIESTDTLLKEEKIEE